MVISEQKAKVNIKLCKWKAFFIKYVEEVTWLRHPIRTSVLSPVKYENERSLHIYGQRGGKKHVVAGVWRLISPPSSQDRTRWRLLWLVQPTTFLLIYFPNPSSLLYFSSAPLCIRECYPGREFIFCSECRQTHHVWVGWCDIVERSGR